MASTTIYRSLSVERESTAPQLIPSTRSLKTAFVFLNSHNDKVGAVCDSYRDTVLMRRGGVERLVQVIEPELETVGHREDRLPAKWGPHRHTSGLFSVWGGTRNKL